MPGFCGRGGKAGNDESLFDGGVGRGVAEELGLVGGVFPFLLSLQNNWVSYASSAHTCFLAFDFG